MTKAKTELPPIHDVDIRQLRLFKIVVECGGLTAAELPLGMSCSTISRHLTALEKRFNLHLCERGRSGFRLTTNGLAVYTAVIDLLDALETFRSQLSDKKKLLTGDISLWITDNSHNEKCNPLRQILTRFGNRPGSVKITLNAADPGSVENAVAAGVAQIGITISNNHLSGLKYEKISEEIASIYCAANHPLGKALSDGTFSESQLQDVDFVERGYLRNDVLVSRYSWKSTAVSQHIEATLQLILTGTFVGIIPEHVAERWVESDQIRKIAWDDPASIATVNLVWRQSATRNLIVNAMLDDIRFVYKNLQ